ncbi:MAG: ATP-binding protein [Elusimicrobia bacterium]|nr:ATP-binding protein [Elusimicrobiota bacterium]
MERIIKRTFWLNKLESLWQKHNIIWLYGVRRAGKTFLSKSVLDIMYFDCELPRIRTMFDNPEDFFASVRGKTIVIDEIHRLGNPSETLKIGADYFPDIRIIATGSSSISSSVKFKDTLTGRKSNLWLLPMTLDDMRDFRRDDIERRLLRGGLPPFFLSIGYPEIEFQQWLDDFWSKDIQELFRLEKKHSFTKLMELLFSQSGGIFDASRFARPCEVSRTTISNYLKILEETTAAYVVRPFSSYKPAEIISAPKVYGFDTGFIAYWRDSGKPSNEGKGLLWEHLVLNEIYAHLQHRKVFYWRDKRGHEIDFTIYSDKTKPAIIECKLKAENFDPAGLFAFRRRYPSGKNFLVAANQSVKFTKSFKNLKVTIISLKDLPGELKSIQTG